MITWKQGDLFASGLPAIAHGVNCQGVMGAGIAAQFRQRWPQMYETYRRRCAREAGLLPGDVMAWLHRGGMIYNLATQYEPGASAQPWMITAAVGRMISEAVYLHAFTEIGLPMIGCGIGGLRPDQLRAALAPYADAPVNLTVFSYVPVNERVTAAVQPHAGMAVHDGFAAHSHEVRPDHLGVSRAGGS